MKNLIKVVLIAIIAMSTKAEQWRPISEGSYNVTYHEKVGNLIVVATNYKTIGQSNPTELGILENLGPINFWDLEQMKFIPFENNWVGDPMNPVKVWKLDSATYFITDEVMIYRADINYVQKEITYEKVFQGQTNLNKIDVFCLGKNNVYFINNKLQGSVYVCNMQGITISHVQIESSFMDRITSFVEWNDTIYVAYTYNGGLSDGSGLGIVNRETGAVTKVRNQLINGNYSGCEIKVIENRFYLRTDPGRYEFKGTIFEYINGIWVPIIIVADMPFFLPRTGDLIIGVGKNAIEYKSGDTLCTTSNLFYKFNNGSIGTKIGEWKDLEPRLDPAKIKFSDEFTPGFYKKHGVMPFIEFIYEFNGKTFGFGPNIVAELVQNTNIRNNAFHLISVYPNPTYGNINISGLENQNEYLITDITGKTVLSGIIDSASPEIDLSVLEKGIYFIKLDSASTKIIKE